MLVLQSFDLSRSSMLGVDAETRFAHVVWHGEADPRGIFSGRQVSIVHLDTPLARRIVKVLVSRIPCDLALTATTIWGSG